MVINKELLQARKKVSDRRPKFVRQESWRYGRLAETWRKPKGKDNKMRRQLSGAPRLVKIGYRSPRKARGLHPSGYTDNIVFNVNDLASLDPSKDAARIAHVIGQRKRLLILAEARAKGIKVLNPGKEQKTEEISDTKDTSEEKKGEKSLSTTERGELKEEEEEREDEKEFEVDEEEDDENEKLMRQTTRDRKKKGEEPRANNDA
jgi:large subunit ribosomal protein L32e